MINIDDQIRNIVSDSWQYWHGRETIGFVSRTSTTETPYTIYDCKRFDRSKADIPAQHQGAVVGMDLEWFIPTAKIPSGLSPKISDIIVPKEGDEYVIQSVSQNGWRNWWRVQSKNIVLAYGLTDTLTLLRPHSINEGGTKLILSYATIFSTNGKIIETSEEYSEQTLGKRQAKRNYEIHSVRFLPWEPGDRIQDQSGIVYQIISSQAPNTIDSLNVFVCERVS